MNFRKFFCWAVINLLLLSCNSNRKNEEDSEVFISTSKNFQIDSSLYKTASIFYDSLKVKNSIKELFINKVYEDQIILTFRAKPAIKEYFRLNKPSYILYLEHHIPFYVYTGIENLVTGDLHYIEKAFDQDTTSSYFLCMSFAIDNNRNFVLINPCNLPFGVDINNSIQPEIDINKYERNSK